MCHVKCERLCGLCCWSPLLIYLPKLLSSYAFACFIMLFKAFSCKLICSKKCAAFSVSNAQYAKLYMLNPTKKCAILCVSNVFIVLNWNNLIPPKSVLLKCEHLSCLSLLKWLQYALYASKRMCLFKCEGFYGLIYWSVLNLPYDAFNVLGSFTWITSPTNHPKSVPL